MIEYMMQWETHIGGLSWEYGYSSPSDNMAKEYAHRHTIALHKTLRYDDAILLWRMSDQKLIARFVINKPTVTNTVE